MPDDILPRDTTYRTTGGFGLGSSEDTGEVELPDWVGTDADAELTVNEDGGVTIYAPAILHQPEPITPANFGENLAKRMSDGDLAMLQQEIHEGVESDIQSRQKFIGNLTEGLDLLGLEIRTQSNSRTEKGSVSKVQHPVLLEAITTAQSRASAEMFPAEGPCKVTVRGGSNEQLDEMAMALEADMNWYLTTGAPEFRSDGERGLFGFFFSGNQIKKVYENPLRRRPVSESIDIEDFIIGEASTDLDTATRMTHRNTEMSPSLVKRMMHFGDWRRVELTQAVATQDQLKLRKAEVQGISPVSIRWQDTPRTIDETITDLDLSEYGFHERGQPDGLPISYAVTMDWDSQEVYAIHRRWKFGDREFKRVHPYVHYQMVPAFGFLALGYVHLLGNQAKALTAIWRILCDAGMFANFPGGVKVKGVRTSTNEINPGPGEWPDIDVGAFDDIRKALMPMPYKDPSAVFIQLSEIIGQDAQRLAGTVELDVGEGRTNIPVGTMLAMVEQATQTTAAVHKRMHAAQQRELTLFKQCFAEHPEALWKLNPDPKRRWQTAAEFENLDLVPASDPNVPAQIHRLMIAMAMVTMATQNPQIYDQVATHLRAWRMLGVTDADQFVRQPPPQPQQDPGATAAQATLQAKQMDVAAKAQDNQRKAATEIAKAQQDSQQAQTDTANAAADRQSKEKIEAMKVETERLRLQSEHDRALRQEAQAERHHAEAQMTAGLTGDGT